ncbi:MAG: CpaF family protein [Alphaproteobacteria bacterium]
MVAAREHMTIDRSRTSDIATTDLYQDIKFQSFQLTLDHLEQKHLRAEDMSIEALQGEISQSVGVALLGEGVALNAAERGRLVEDVRNEIRGLGPLEPLLADPDCGDIIVNGCSRVYVERKGKLMQVAVRFRDNEHLMSIIHRIVGPIGRRVDEANPFVDARLPDGSRVNIVIPPISLDGPMVSIRKFNNIAFTGHELVRLGSASQGMVDFLSQAVLSRLNILVLGGTGSGKTTLLNMLSAYIPNTERLVTIEDAAELQLQQDHVVRLETRPASPEGGGEVSARDLVRNALRMRPDRILLGEVRGAEAVDMLQAMSTGHDGSLATMHANSARDGLARLEMLLGFGGLEADTRLRQRYISSAVQLIVQTMRLADGQRRITSVMELTGVEGDTYSLNELYRFVEDPPLSGRGHFETLSRRPFFSDRMAVTPAQARQAQR